MNEADDPEHPQADTPSAASDSDVSALDNPWWIPPFLGRVPQGIEPQHLQVLAFVAFAMAFETYDLGLMSAALPQIARDFSLDDVQKGYFMGAIDLGALPSFLLVPFADRIGRRRLLLICLIGMSIGSCLTAFSPSALVFAGLQVLTRTFAVTATVTSFVIVAEEFPAGHRGWGVGMLNSVGAMGYAMVAILYSQVERLPFGWRSIYFLSGAAIFWLPYFRSRIKETRRFRAAEAQLPAQRSLRGLLMGGFAPLVDLARRHKRRALVLGTMAMVSTVGHRPAFRFVSDFLQTSQGWSPGGYATMTLVAGVFGLMGGPIAGRLGDRFGRRKLGAAMLVPFPIAAGAFYMSSGYGAVVPWVVMVFLALAANVVIRSLSTELFPTSVRGAASGWILLVETLGAGLGLALYSLIESIVSDVGLSLTLVSFAAAISALSVFFLPDTHQRELESISHDP